MSGARPMEIVASTDLMSVSNVFVLFHYLLWKAKLDLTALSEDLDSWSINVSFSTGFIASCGVMKTPSCIIRIYITICTQQLQYKSDSVITTGGYCIRNIRCFQKPH